MTESHLRERERHRALALADAMMNLRHRLDELESLHRAMVESGVEPRHVILAENREYLEKWFYYHERRALWRLRFPGPSGRKAQISEAKRRALVAFEAS